jgi:hypothetical protein
MYTSSPGVRHGWRWYIIEIKLIRSYNTPEEIKTEGLRQITAYRDKIDSSAPAYLVLFDRRPETKQKPWEERITWTTEGAVQVLGC